ncbi:hypothetical protein LO767_00150 [Halopseudomonas aestusnigri]|uniref:hypothetical protein n=1 Tax=Halopseudomonas aestusnigri TaxID=857252 RepID=UPI001E427199|nr:hypothetical protein [Halopseudomonas aestusnigri]UGV30973.1 hypothetical protein LO767_00150 [Halopseudomonas aestusnigri]
MIFYVTRMRVKGRPLTPEQINRAERIQCNVSVRHESCDLGRASVVARTAGSGGPLEKGPLPDLIDVQLHSMVPNAMVLSGIEEIDGVMYAQSWLCRPEP